ncbi:hypothetical protein QR680_001150 [Steinernema hermaphroditum]|nr:hypothetical protein QR680_001150 [Steinernema hermaphroditum]
MIRVFVLITIFGLTLCRQTSDMSPTTEEKMIDLLNFSTNSPLVELLEAIRFSMTSHGGVQSEEDLIANATSIDLVTTSIAPSIQRLELHPNLADILRKVFARKEEIMF